MMTFYYSFSDPSINGTITIDTKKYQTVDNLITKIASDLHIERFQIEIKNTPEVTSISSLPNNYEFQLKIKCRREDIKFNFPKEVNITIKGGYKMSFNDVIKSFQNDGFFFSPDFIKNNLSIMIKGKEFLHEGFPFFGVLFTDKIEVQMNGNFVIIDYDQRQFFFSEDEYSWDSSKFICNFFPDLKYPSSIYFTNTSTGKILKGGDKLKHNEKYNISIDHTFNFKNISMFCNRLQHLDFLSKIPDAKQRLAIIFSDNNELSPENIIIFDKNKNIIEDQNQYLKDIKNDMGEIYFDISKELKTSSSKMPNETESKQSYNSEGAKLTSASKEVTIDSKHLSSFDDTKISHSNPQTKKKNNFKPKIVQIEKSPDSKSHGLTEDSETPEPTKASSLITIHFIFEENDDDEVDDYSFMPFNKEIDLNSTIDEIKKDIKKQYKIDNKINIECKDGDSKTSVGKKMKIKDIVDDIKEESEHGETKYVLYIKITENSKKKQGQVIDHSTIEPETELDLESKTKDDEKLLLHSDINSHSSDGINNNNSSDNQHEDDIPKETNKKKKKVNLRKFIPTKKSINNSPLPSKANSNKQKFKFVYEGSEKDIKLDTNSRLKDNEQIIKNKFGISKTQKLDFFIIKNDQDDSEETMINNKKRKMETLKNYTIKIYQQDESDEHSRDDDQEYQETQEIKQINSSNDNINDNNNNDNIAGNKAELMQNQVNENEIKPKKCKYYYQTNRKDEIEEIELDAGTSVKEMKQIIAENNGVDSLSNIKVIFAGKDLLNELILDDLEIGDIPLYVYIRSTEDILLMTAKALVIKKEDLDSIEEEEETE